MGCDPWNNNSLDSCIAYQPGTGDGVSVEFTEHPLNAIRSNGAYNIPDREGIAVMYPSIILTGNPVVNNSSSNCGKVTRAVPTNSQLCPGNNPCMFVYDYYPEELSFDYGVSDTWFSYLYDTSNEQGIIGKPCYYYESSSAVTSDGDPANDNTVSGGNCIPCTNFTCDPATTTLTYTIDEESLTGDPDCPHPTSVSYTHLTLTTILLV